MHYKYFNSFHVDCHDFAGVDEIIFTIVLCGLDKASEHPIHISNVSTAISHFRDHGRPLYGWLYSAVEAAWDSCARCDPFLVMRYVNDPVDELPTGEQAAKIRRQRLWNAVMRELRFPDCVDIAEDGEIPNTLPTRQDLRRLIRSTIGPQLRDRLERALGKAIATPEVQKRVVEIPLGGDHDLPDLEAERDRFWLIFFPDYLEGAPIEYLEYLARLN
jgi:hypothetical protein